MPKNPPPPVCPKCGVSMHFVIVKTGGRKFKCVNVMKLIRCKSPTFRGGRVA